MASWSPRCLPDASQMLPRCTPDASPNIEINKLQVLTFESYSKLIFLFFGNLETEHLNIENLKIPSTPGPVFVTSTLVFLGPPSAACVSVAMPWASRDNMQGRKCLNMAQNTEASSFNKYGLIVEVCLVCVLKRLWRLQDAPTDHTNRLGTRVRLTFPNRAKLKN